MLDRLYKLIADYLLSKKAFAEDDYDVVVYGLDGVIFTIIPKGVICILGALTGVFIPTLFFELAASPLQLQGGGFHARSHAKCMLFTTLCWVLFFTLFTYVPFVAALLMSFVAYLIVWIFAPVENINAPIPERMRKRAKYFDRRYVPAVIVISSLLQILTTFQIGGNGSIASIVNFLTRYNVPKACLLGICVVSFSMFVGQFSSDTVNAKFVRNKKTQKADHA